MGVWGVFAFFGKTPVDGFISAVGAALAALGTIHAMSGKKSDDATPPAQ
jgi:hypothetical protein